VARVFLHGSSWQEAQFSCCTRSYDSVQHSLDWYYVIWSDNVVWHGAAQKSCSVYLNYPFKAIQFFKYNGMIQFCKIQQWFESKALIFLANYCKNSKHRSLVGTVSFTFSWLKFWDTFCQACHVTVCLCTAKPSRLKNSSVCVLISKGTLQWKRRRCRSAKPSPLFTYHMKRLKLISHLYSPKWSCSLNSVPPFPLLSSIHEPSSEKGEVSKILCSLFNVPVKLVKKIGVICYMLFVQLIMTMTGKILHQKYPLGVYAYSFLHFKLNVWL
jgi:hypothetical protein